MRTYIPFQSPQSHSAALSSNIPTDVMDCGIPLHELQVCANSEKEELEIYSNYSIASGISNEDCCIVGEKRIISDRVQDNPVSNLNSTCNGTLNTTPTPHPYEHVIKKEPSNFVSTENDTHALQLPCPTPSVGNFLIQADLTPLFNGAGSVSCTISRSVSGSTTPLGIRRSPLPCEITASTVFDSLDAAIESITTSQAAKGFKVVKKDATNGRLRNARILVNQMNFFNGCAS